MAATAEIAISGRSRTLTEMGPLLFGYTLLAGGVAAAALVSAPDVPAGDVAEHGLSVALPIGLAVFLLATGRNLRVAAALLTAGLLGVVVTFAESSQSGLYSIGRVAIWLFEPVLVYLILTFPTGRFPGRTERRLF